MSSQPKGSLHSRVTLGLVFSLVFAVAAASAGQAQTYTDIHDFDGRNNGCCPDRPALLAQGRDGNLYGTALGGVNGDGIVFKITPAGSLSVVYPFTGGDDGFSPRSGLTLGTDGNFYGTTRFGGKGTSATGTIFKVTPGGTLTTLYTFTGGIDGGRPWGPPVQGTDGNFYGTTEFATAYKITPSGAFTPLGAIPGQSFSPVIQAADGNLYGTTVDGGAIGAGTVFKISLAGKITIFRSFDGTHGSGPYGPVFQGNDRNFYGATSGGGTKNRGVVFKMSPTGAITVLHSFDPTDTADGNDPMAGTVVATDGNVYGDTQLGNTTSSQGVFFKTNSTGTSYSVLHTFDGTTGGAPQATPMQHTNGKIYGLTPLGGSTGNGVVYTEDLGLAPSVKLVSTLGKVGKTIGILGSGFTGTTAVKFNGVSATFAVVLNTYLTATVPTAATSGFVQVTTPGGTLTSSAKFGVTPTISSFSPTSGPVGTSVVISGNSLLQTTKVTFGGVKATSVTMISNTHVTAVVPSGAKTGKIAVTTAGGTASSSAVFTVTP